MDVMGFASTSKEGQAVVLMLGEKKNVLNLNIVSGRVDMKKSLSLSDIRQPIGMGVWDKDTSLSTNGVQTGWSRRSSKTAAQGTAS